MGNNTCTRDTSRKQQAGLEQAEATVRERQRRLEATKITGDVNARRVGKMRMLSVNVPGSQAPDGSASQQVRMREA